MLYINILLFVRMTICSTDDMFIYDMIVLYVIYENYNLTE